jgi:hypothetical protein
MNDDDCEGNGTSVKKTKQNKTKNKKKTTTTTTITSFTTTSFTCRSGGVRRRLCAPVALRTRPTPAASADRSGRAPPLVVVRGGVGGGVVCLFVRSVVWLSVWERNHMFAYGDAYAAVLFALRHRLQRNQNAITMTTSHRQGQTDTHMHFDVGFARNRQRLHYRSKKQEKRKKITSVALINQERRNIAHFDTCARRDGSPIVVIRTFEHSNNRNSISTIVIDKLDISDNVVVFRQQIERN